MPKRSSYFLVCYLRPESRRKSRTVLGLPGIYVDTERPIYFRPHSGRKASIHIYMYINNNPCIFRTRVLSGYTRSVKSSCLCLHDPYIFVESLGRIYKDRLVSMFMPKGSLHFRPEPGRKCKEGKLYFSLHFFCLNAPCIPVWTVNARTPL